MPRLTEMFPTAEALQAAVDAYISECEASVQVYPLKNGGVQVRIAKPASIAGLAVYLHVHKDTLYSYISGEHRSSIDGEVYKQLSECLGRARDRIEALTVGHAMAGDLDSKTATLILNGYGYNRKEDESPSVTVRIEGANAADAAEWSR